MLDYRVQSEKRDSDEEVFRESKLFLLRCYDGVAVSFGQARSRTWLDEL